MIDFISEKLLASYLLPGSEIHRTMVVSLALYTPVMVEYFNINGMFRRT